MKPVYVVILILAGALAGAVGLKFIQTAKLNVPRTTVAQVQALPATVAAPRAPAVQVSPQEPSPAIQAPHAEPEPVAVPERAKPSPMPPLRREAPKPQRFHTAAPLYGNPEPVERPALPATPEPAPAAQVAPVVPPSNPIVAPPPASTEPEHVTPGSPQSSVPPTPQPHQVTLNAGLLLPVRLVDGLSSERNVPGDVFHATLDKELVVDGFVIAERGARVEGRVVAADRGGKVRGVAALAVELTRLHTSDGQLVTIQTDSFFKHAEATHDQDAAKVGGGAVIGAVIGALAGGGKGAAIGAGVGGGAGAGDVLLTRGKPAELPSETRVTFRLKTRVQLTERRGD